MTRQVVHAEVLERKPRMIRVLESNADNQPVTADLVEQRQIGEGLRQAAAETFAKLPHAGNQRIGEKVQRRVSRNADGGATTERAIVRLGGLEVLAISALEQLAPRQHGRNRQKAATEMFPKQDRIRTTRPRLARQKSPRPSEPGLHLVCHEQYLVLSR